ncbi:DUF1048 domain-containing protein [Enemella evansiae]|uniref:DUF1048 domain-containing protein n=1 Tax=Enemella evansiae TaxID=2016499 RepID=A0A255GIA1_9ACTN|nr:DUF1048 domain-containing protein [Enemella evansiae]OYO03978.1 hypothetical protein CGZ97_11340 [Enemella evansiae]OYO08285.1 hypothetical protein CGZ98_17230 [Enemella evansiae]OYO12704.1 hypothetical protein CGZ94_12380 [Enemella evansiae]
MEISKIIKKVTGDLEDKKRWWAIQERIKALPESHRTAAKGLERYLTYRGGITRGDELVTMLDDLAQLFEEAAANGTPIRDIVGADPVDFAEEFLNNYSESQWINSERVRLVEAIDRAEAGEGER